MSASVNHVFISSTGPDLQEYRKAAIDTCNKLGLVPIAMEFFGAMGASAVPGSKSKLDEANLYIGIFAYRYGTIADGYDKSVTEIEFDYAGQLELDRLCFIVDPTYPWPPDAIDYINHSQLLNFKQKVSKSVILSQFTTIDNFTAKLIQAILEWQKHRNIQPAIATTSINPSIEPVYTMNTSPPRPSLVIGRESDTDSLKARFGINTSQPSNPITIIRGWPGVGKTVLVNSLIYDADVRKTFPDGILWVALGENINPYIGLAAWAEALHIVVEKNWQLEELIAKIRATLINKRMLLIIDDVWDAADALPFRVAGGSCIILITTRFQDIARELAPLPDDIYLLGQLTDEKGVELISRLAPTVVAQFPKEVLQLIKDLEGLPLALRVAGRLLEAEAILGFDVLDILNALSNSSKLLDAKAPDDRYDPKIGIIPTVSLLLKKSSDHLDEETRNRFAYLGAFAPKPATFDLDAMKAIWAVDDPKPTARILADRGLLEPIIGRGRFQMHAVLAMYADSLFNEKESDAS